MEEEREGQNVFIVLCSCSFALHSGLAQKMMVGFKRAGQMME